jgi:hemoglobin
MRERDIQDHDLPGLLHDFYSALEGDPLLAPYFADLDMSEHIPRIAAFWSTVLFNTRRYADNAFQPHQQLPGLSAEHFSRWVRTLEATIDARFCGLAAEEMKTAAHRIAYSMQLRLGIPPFAAWPDRSAATDPNGG